MEVKLPSMKKLTVMQQYSDFKKNLPSWTTKLEHNGFTAKGTIQPTLLSECYSLRVSYAQNGSPVVRVLNGQLKPRVADGKIKHTYSDGSVCLYYPKAKEWTVYDLITETIIPWVSVWLYYYEIWYATGEWLGGGIEHR